MRYKNYIFGSVIISGIVGVFIGILLTYFDNSFANQIIEIMVGGYLIIEFAYLKGRKKRFDVSLAHVNDHLKLSASIAQQWINQLYQLSCTLISLSITYGILMAYLTHQSNLPLDLSQILGFNAMFFMIVIATIVHNTNVAGLIDGILQE